MKPDPPTATRFLYAIGNLLSATALYGPDHPARRRGAELAHRELESLLAERPRVAFSFLEDEVVCGEKPLSELRGWPWCRRLADAGIQRLECVRGISAAELQAVVSELADRLESRQAEPVRHPHIRFGPLGVATDRRARGANGRSDAPLDLREEAEAVRWINEEAGRGATVPTAEASAVVRGLSVAMHGARELIAPLLRIKNADQYTTAHCINVSILAMSLAEYLKFGDAEVRAIGEAALLHDIGKTRIPTEVLNKPGLYTPEERALVERHPVEGARLLLQADPRNALAAVVAYEHHMRWREAGGYPERHYSRRPHRFSRLVQVCDVYDALRTRRPFRAPLTARAALDFLRDRAGDEFDPDLVTAFTEMMERWEPDLLPPDADPSDRDVSGPGSPPEDPARGPGPFDPKTAREPLAG